MEHGLRNVGLGLLGAWLIRGVGGVVFVLALIIGWIYVISPHIDNPPTHVTPTERARYQQILKDFEACQAAMQAHPDGGIDVAGCQAYNQDPQQWWYYAP